MSSPYVYGLVVVIVAAPIWAGTAAGGDSPRSPRAATRPSANLVCRLDGTGADPVFSSVRPGYRFVVVSAGCTGDSNGDGKVTVDEVVVGVAVALGIRPPVDGAALDENEDGRISIDELIRAVTNMLEGCPNPAECATACDCANHCACVAGRCASDCPEPLYCCDAGPCPEGEQCEHRSGASDTCRAQAPTATSTLTPSPSNTPTLTATPTPEVDSTKDGELTVSDPTFRRPGFTFTQGGRCSPSIRGNRTFFYDVYEFFNGGGPKTVRASNCPAHGGSADFDSVLAIYQDPSGAQSGFDPSDGCKNALAYNDNADLPGCVRPGEVSARVGPGYYYVVVSSFDTETTGSYTLGISGDSREDPLCTTACDCPAGQGCLDSGFCSSGAAIRWCCGTSQCPDGQRCQAPDGSDGICGQGCTTACDCGNHCPCVDGQCAPECFVPVYCCDADACPAGEQCDYRAGGRDMCQARAPTPTPTSTRTPTPTRTPKPVMTAYLKGDTSCEWGSHDCNPTIRDVPGQIMTLRDFGEVLGFRYDGSLPNVVEPGRDLNHKWSHWQGVQRLMGNQWRGHRGNSRYLLVDISNTKGLTSGSYDGPAGLATVWMASRSSQNGRRFRSNRLDPSLDQILTAPPNEDRMSHFRFLDDWESDRDHPGGIQMLGDFLFVPIENSNHTSPSAMVGIYDVSHPNDPRLVNEINQYPKPRATEVAAAKLSDGRYLVVVGVGDRLRIYVSRGTGPRLPGVPGSGPLEYAYFGEPRTIWDRSRDGLHSAIPPDFHYADYQNINLITQSDGKIFMVGAHNDGSIKEGHLPNQGKDWLDVFRLDIDASSFAVSVTKVAKHHMYCSSGHFIPSRQCNMAAATGTYIDPDGRLIVYATEHWKDGPGSSIKLMEFRSSFSPTSCATLHDAWVELYVDSYFGSDDTYSLMIDFDDRGLKHYEDFTNIPYGGSWAAPLFNDTASSVRWCLPEGNRFNLFQHDHYKGKSYALFGTGGLGQLSFKRTSVNQVPKWLQDEVSSGRFECDTTGNGDWQEASPACPAYAPPPLNPSAVTWLQKRSGVLKVVRYKGARVPNATEYSVSPNGVPDRNVDVSASGDGTDSYTSKRLQPGTYSLRVRSVDSHGVWNPHYLVSPPVVVEAPHRSADVRRNRAAQRRGRDVRIPAKPCARIPHSRGRRSSPSTHRATPPLSTVTWDVAGPTEQPPFPFAAETVYIGGSVAGTVTVAVSRCVGWPLSSSSQ